MSMIQNSNLPARSIRSPCKIAFLGALAAAPITAAFAGPIGPPAPNGPHILTDQRSGLHIGFDTLLNAATNDTNRIDSFIDYNANTGGYDNYDFAATEPSGGPANCKDPDEYFGQALGYPDATAAPMMVASGQRGTWTSKEMGPYSGRFTVAETYTHESACKGVNLTGLVRTKYALGSGLFPNFSKIFSGVVVERTFRFPPGLGVLNNTGLRAFVPRINIQEHYVLVPNKEGQLVTYDSQNCTSAPCTVTDWDGTWFADDYGEGIGVVIIRDPSSTMPAFIGIQSGGAANSNYSSIVLSQPAGGWSGLVTETEILCVYTRDVWIPQPGTLPYNCPIPPKPAASK